MHILMQMHTETDAVRKENCNTQQVELHTRTCIQTLERVGVVFLNALFDADEW